MGKTIFSKVVSVGGARTSTVGVGVMLAVILLGLAAAIALPTPAVAAHGPPHPPTATALNQQVAEDEALSSGGPPYRVQVDTFWQLRDDGPLNCKPGTLKELWRETRGGTGAHPYALVWQSTEDRDLYRVRQGLQASDREPFPTYHYFHLARCQNPSGDMVTGSTIGVPFSLHVIEDPWAYFTYSGDWITDRDSRATGGTTHEARQVGATANLSYGGIASAWLTTVDEKDYPIWAQVRSDGCSGMLCPRWIDTGSHEFGDARVVKWSSSWTGWYGNSYNRAHTVQVTSHESRLVDVDAFVLVVARRP